MRKFFKLGLFIVFIVGLAVILRSGADGVTSVTGQASLRSVVADAGDQSSVSAFDAPLLEDELPAGLSINARVAFVRELSSDSSIISYHSQNFWPIASITKLMTAVIAEETLGENAKITISREALDVEGVAGNLKVGQKYTSWDLIKAMLTVSSNDAAEALALAYEKDNAGLSFVAKMNAKAAELGMTDATYADATGLSMVNQATAGDLYKLVLHISQRYPDLWKVTRNKTNTITDINSGKRQTLTSINLLSGTEGFIGGKTGRTDESGDNLISIFTHHGRQYMFLVFGADDRFVETKKLVDWLKKQSDGK